MRRTSVLQVFALQQSVPGFVFDTPAASATVAVGTSTVTVAGSTMTAGAMVLAGSGTALGLSAGEALAAAAIGGAVGDAAGQLAGDALGVHHGFSLGEMAGAGLGAGITAGVGSELAAAHVAGMEAGAIEGAAGYAGQVVAGKLTGQSASFSWANLVASAVGGAITTKLDLPTNTQLQEGESSGNFLRDFGGSLVNGAIDSETARLLGGDAANGRQIFEDAFGNALGNAAVGGIEEANRAEEERQAKASPQNPPIVIDPGQPGVQVQDINAPLAPISPANLTYTVQKGDSLSGITANLLGDGGPTAVGMVMAANHLTSDEIYPGQVLTIGSLDQYGADTQAQFHQTGQTVFAQRNARMAAQAASAFQSLGQQLSAYSVQESSSLSALAEPDYAALINYGGGNGGGISPLQAQLMCTNPNSPQYTQLAEQVNAEQQVEAFNRGDMGEMGLLELDGQLILAQQAFNNHVPTDGFMSAAPERSVDLPTELGMLEGNPFASGAYGLAAAFGADDQTAYNVAGATGALTSLAAAGVGGYAVMRPSEVGEVGQLDAARASAEFQGKDPYWGVDPLQNTSLSQGSFLVQLTYANNGVPIGSYFIGADVFESSRLPDGSYDANVLNQGVQKFAGRNNPDFVPYAQIYMLLDDVPNGGAAVGPTTANPYFNPGQYKTLGQIYLLPEFYDSLMPVHLVPLSNTRAPVYTPRNEIANNMLRQDTQ